MIDVNKTEMFEQFKKEVGELSDSILHELEGKNSLVSSTALAQSFSLVIAESSLGQDELDMLILNIRKTVNHIRKSRMN